ncbi:MAG: hypothetical protein M3270_01705 [Thermoproteota archaeon]|nr:hypothetical protein [Thermoproteota archaeon]
MRERSVTQIEDIKNQAPKCCAQFLANLAFKSAIDDALPFMLDIVNNYDNASTVIPSRTIRLKLSADSFYSDIITQNDQLF